MPFRSDHPSLSYPLADRSVENIHELLLDTLSEELAGAMSVGLAEEFGKKPSKLWNLAKDFIGLVPDPVPLEGQMKVRVLACIEETRRGRGEFACVDIILDEVAGSLSVTFEARAYRNDGMFTSRGAGLHNPPAVLRQMPNFLSDPLYPWLSGNPRLQPEALARANSIWRVVMEKVSHMLEAEIGHKLKPEEPGH